MAMGRRRLLAGCRQLPRQLTLDVTVISREYKHRPAQVEVNGIYDGNVFRGYQDVTQNDILLITDNHWNSFVYRGVEIDVTSAPAACS